MKKILFELGFIHVCILAIIIFTPLVINGCGANDTAIPQIILDRQKLCKERGHIPYCTSMYHPHAETNVYDNDTMSYKIWWKYETKEFICERCSDSWVEEKELSVDTIVYWRKK